MAWRSVSNDVPEGEPILVSCDGQAVVALAFPGDYYYPQTTFMDARTFDILPTPTHWMAIENPPPARLAVDAGACRRAA